MRVTMYRERSGIFVLQWGGRKDRHYLSTGVKDKALAAAVRERKERELTLDESSPEIALIVREEVQRALSSLPVPSAARTGSTVVSKPVREAAKEYVEFQRGTLGNSESHVDDVERQLRMFLDHARVSTPNELTRAHPESFVARVRADGLGDKSARDKWSILKKFFDWARKRKYMLDVIADEENRPKMPAFATVRAYTAAEALAIMEAIRNPKETHRITVQEFWLPFDTYDPSRKKADRPDRNALTGEELRKRHEPYFKSMDDHVRELNEKHGKSVVFVVPVGQAVIALREKIIAGQAPGLKTQEELFTDAIGHVRAPVQVLNAYCHFAVIYRRSPVGLPLPGVLARAKLAEEDKLNRLLQELAWAAVVGHPLSGPKP
jgi:hypothetical protein